MQIKASIFAIIFGIILVSSPAMSQDSGPNVVPVPESIRERVSTSAKGLTEEFAISGRVVRLQGRFQSLTTATIDDTGRPVVKCYSPGSDLEPHFLHPDHSVRK